MRERGRHTVKMRAYSSNQKASISRQSNIVIDEAECHQTSPPTADKFNKPAYKSTAKARSRADSMSPLGDHKPTNLTMGQNEPIISILTTSNRNICPPTTSGDKEPTCSIKFKQNFEKYISSSYSINSANAQPASKSAYVTKNNFTCDYQPNLNAANLTTPNCETLSRKSSCNSVR